VGEVTIDKAGRVVIPKFVRDQLRLEPGDSLELDSDGRAITLRPQRSATPLRKERGVWVHCGAPLTVAETQTLIDDARHNRDVQSTSSS